MNSCFIRRKFRMGRELDWTRTLSAGANLLARAAVFFLPGTIPVAGILLGALL